MQSEIRVFTAARRFPQMVGRLPNGQPIPGGPYTATQFLGGSAGIIITAILAGSTGLNPLAVLAVGVPVTIVGAVLLGRIPYDGVPMHRRFWRWFVTFVDRTPISASGIPVDDDTARRTVVHETVIPVEDHRHPNSPERGRP